MASHIRFYYPEPEPEHPDAVSEQQALAAAQLAAARRIDAVATEAAREVLARVYPQPQWDGHLYCNHPNCLRCLHDLVTVKPYFASKYPLRSTHYIP
jgi:hypothetical protein